VTRRAACRLGVLAATALAAWPAAPRAAPPLTRGVVVEHLGAQLPLERMLRDSRGQAAPLGAFLGGGPALLVFGYYHCTMLCGMVLEGAVDGLRALERGAKPGDADAQGFRLVSLSIDPRDDARSAAQRQQPVLRKLGWPETRWPFLTGRAEDVRAIAERAGFGYAFDAASGEYAHTAALVVLAPGGRVAGYLYGIDFSAEQLRLALRDARAGTQRSSLARVLLRCFHYVPALRRHGGAIALGLRLGGALALLALGALLLRLWRIELARRAR
jgi:protein SCO1/2